MSSPKHRIQLPFVVGIWRTTFSHHVIHVVLLRTEEEVVVIYASWNITHMAHEHPVWYLSYIDHIGDSMRTKYPAKVANLSVPVWKMRTKPYAAS